MAIIKWNDIIEDAIIGRLVARLVELDFRVQLSDTDGGGLYLYAMPDGAEFPVEGGYDYWVRLVQGNGASVISDFSLNLEAILEPVNNFAAAFE